MDEPNVIGPGKSLAVLTIGNQPMLKGPAETRHGMYTVRTCDICRLKFWGKS